MLKSNLEGWIKLKLKYIKEVLKLLSKFEQICFRGGTALSLTYEAIERFSEDIDITIFKGKLNIKNIANQIIENLEKMEWVSKVCLDSEEINIIIEFENKYLEPKTTFKFSYNKIHIELPKIMRKNNELSYKKIPPYKDANFSMKVMSLNEIFADKSSILIEKYSYDSTFSWALDERATARHIYDVQMLMEKKLLNKVDYNYIYKRVYSGMLKKDTGKLRGKDEFKKRKQMEFFNKSKTAAFIEFKENILKKKDELQDKVKLLVYPKSKNLNIKKMLTLYEKIFKFIFTIIKENLLKPYKENN